MDEPRTVNGLQPQRSQRMDQGAVAPLSRLALTALEAEEFFATGTPAYPAEAHPPQPVSMQWSDAELDGLGRNGPPVDAAAGPARTWIIQRCTGWVGGELRYVDFPAVSPRMTREEMVAELARVSTMYPAFEFRGHNTARPTAAPPALVEGLHLAPAEAAAFERVAGTARCGECGYLRSATPPHSPGCRFAAGNCPGCLDVKFTHIASCRKAAQSATCCVGEDVPELGGWRHSADCLNRQTAAALIDRLVDEPGPFVDALARIRQRDVAIARLMAAGRGLALSAIRHWRAYDPSVGAVRPVANCRECDHGCIGDGRIVHRRACHVGQVLDALEDLAGIAVELAALDVAGAIDQADGGGGNADSGGAA